MPYRLALPYRERANALVLEKARLSPENIHHDYFLEHSEDDGEWAQQAELAGMSMQFYVDPATNQTLPKGVATVEALPGYVEIAELDRKALGAYDKLKDENGDMPFNLKEKLESPEVGYHIMDGFLPEVDQPPPEDPSDAKNYLWSIHRGFLHYLDMNSFFNVDYFQQTKSHGITKVTYDPYGCLHTSVELPDGCITPLLSVIDNRGLPVRQVAYWRGDSNQSTPQARTRVAQHDALGRLVAQRDPRFLAPHCRPNVSNLYNLAGNTLFTNSVDGGWRLALSDETGQVAEHWDGRGSHWRTEYDSQRRVFAIHEQTPGAEQRTVERLTYAGNALEFAERNQCGARIRHDDRAGVSWLDQLALGGEPMVQRQRFLPDRADVQGNWPVIESERDALLQPGEGYTTRSWFGALGQMVEQCDACGHRQHLGVDRAGQLQRIDLSLSSQVEQSILKAAHYDAQGQLLSQTTGNDVNFNAIYEASTGRLQRLTATTLQGMRLQELEYEYDPVGNVELCLDHTQVTTFFANQRVAAHNTYAYDSLYQLIRASGRETLDAGAFPGLPQPIIPTPIDPSRLLNYTEHYDYDAGGNRIGLRHVSDTNPFSQQLCVDPHSNRALPCNPQGGEPDFLTGFDANGNLQQLAPGAQALTWSALNQLSSVTTVQRPTRIDDGEWYRYNSAGERVVKFNVRQARSVAHQRIVRYLPGLELRSRDDDEALEVIRIALPRGSVRVLHWLKGMPAGIEADQQRYSVDDHLGNGCLELDGHAAVISLEGLYPFGGTAWWAARTKVEADYRTLRYSGKERDDCGLDYFGFRYYAPWLGRWVNPDPAGEVDGLNRYAMVGNNPTSFRDLLGKNRTPINKEIIMVWAGEKPEKLEQHRDNINNTVTQAEGYRVKLYLDTSTEDAFNETIKELKVHEVFHLQGSALFDRFYETPAAAVYNDFRWFDDRNLAFAVDVSRMYLLNDSGGLYSDVDDVYYDADTDTQARLGDMPLEAGPDEVLTLEPILVNGVMPLKINNSSFAAHANNAILSATLDEMVARYDRARSTYKNILDPMGLGATTIIHANKLDRSDLLLNMTGPGVLTDMIAQHDSEMGNLLSQFNQYQAGQITSLSPTANAQRQARMPLSRYINMGSAGSWN